MYAHTNLGPSPKLSLRNGLMATCVAVSALGFALPAHAQAAAFAASVPPDASIHDVQDSSCQFTSTLPETWGQFVSALNAAMEAGRINAGDYMEICGMNSDGRHGRLIPVYGLSGPDGLSPTISLHKYLPG